MDDSTTVALVTGASRGLGREFTTQLLERGAKVYAAARDPQTVEVPGAIPIALDVTDADAVAKLPELVPDVTFVINNAGVSLFQNLVDGDLPTIRRELETNVFGPLLVIRALAPTLKANGGGAILNLLSALSWASYDGANGYALSKAAAWSVTNGVRLELAGQGTQVTGFHVGSVDTDMVKDFDIPKHAPADVVRAALDGVADGQSEIVFDEESAAAKAAVGQPVG